MGQMPRATPPTPSPTPPPTADPATAPPEPTTPTREPIVRLRNVSKRFGDLIVLDDVSLDFHRGSTTVVLGPSGAGKSVLIKHIVGLIEPDSGHVEFDGKRVDGVSEKRRVAIRKRIGFLFQLSALFDSMSIRENLEFPLIEHTKDTAAARIRRVREALALVDLEGVEGKRPSQLSGGQQKRAALARAIILRPDLILYDEPTTGLDPIRAAGINALIVKLQHELDATSIVVTHDLASAKAVGDRVVMLRDAKIAADGTLDDLWQSPDRHVRSFLAGRYEADVEEPPPPPASPPPSAPPPSAPLP